MYIQYNVLLLVRFTIIELPVNYAKAVDQYDVDMYIQYNVLLLVRFTCTIIELPVNYAKAVDQYDMWT